VIQELHFLPEQVTNRRTSSRSVDDPSNAIDRGCVLQGGAILNVFTRENSACSS